MGKLVGTYQLPSSSNVAAIYCRFLTTLTAAYKLKGVIIFRRTTPCTYFTVSKSTNLLSTGNSSKSVMISALKYTCDAVTR